MADRKKRPISVKLAIPKAGTGDPLYAFAKLGIVVETLATHRGAIRDRLWVQRDLVPISDRDMPAELLADWQKLKADMRRVEPNARGQTRYGATISRVRLETCEAFASRIVNLYERLRAFAI